MFHTIHLISQMEFREQKVHHIIYITQYNITLSSTCVVFIFTTRILYVSMYILLLNLLILYR